MKQRLYFALAAVMLTLGMPAAGASAAVYGAGAAGAALEEAEMKAPGLEPAGRQVFPWDLCYNIHSSSCRRRHVREGRRG